MALFCCSSSEKPALGGAISFVLSCLMETYSRLRDQMGTALSTCLADSRPTRFSSWGEPERKAAVLVVPPVSDFGVPSPALLVRWRENGPWCHVRGTAFYVRAAPGWAACTVSPHALCGSCRSHRWRRCIYRPFPSSWQKRKHANP